MITVDTAARIAITELLHLLKEKRLYTGPLCLPYQMS